MGPVEIGMIAGSLLLAAAGTTYVTRLVRISGRDRPENPERVKRVLATAPYDRLDNVLAK